MWPLALRLQAAGFKVLHWGYPTLFQNIEQHAQRLHRYFLKDCQTSERWHIVAHSMGSIVVRAALRLGLPPHLGRIVMLAPPNRGSPVAAMASRWVGSLLAPTAELSTRADSYVNQLSGLPEIEVGILAAKYDLLVPAGNTQLPGQTGHETLLATHNSLLWSRRAARKVVTFLKNGAF
jgi:pimeloyl-ACP methyl ester carboxylesterase